MLMTDEWFTEHVFQIVADRKNVDKELVDLFEHGTPSVLPRWVSRIKPLSPFVLVVLTASLNFSRRIPWELSLDRLSFHQLSLDHCSPESVPAVSLSFLYLQLVFFCRTPRCLFLAITQTREIPFSMFQLLIGVENLFPFDTSIPLTSTSLIPIDSLVSPL